MFLKLVFLTSIPIFAQYSNSAAVNLPTYAQGLTNFPYLISCNSTVQSCPQFKTVANGGQVQNSSGFDIAFYADSGCSTTKLNWEIEDWSATTGNGDWWVQVPVSTNTFYECWNNTSISTDQSSKTATWSGENYQFVMHGGTPSSFSNSDSSANAISGSTTSVSAGTGIINGAGTWNGSSSLVDYGAAASVQCTPTCTVEAWVKTSSNPSEQDIVSNQWNFCCNGIILDQKSSPVASSPQFTIGNANAHADNAAVAMSIADGNWHLLAATYSSGQMRLYVDGLLVLSRLSQYTSISYSGSAHLIIGRDSNGSDNFFSGQIDEVRISSDAKSQAWEIANYQVTINAVHTTQQVHGRPLLYASSYTGSNSVTSTGMIIAQSVDGINWNGIFQSVESGLLVPVIMQWNGFLWRVHQVAPSTCSGSGPEYIIDKTPIPLAQSSTFSSVSTVCISASVGTTYEGESWFIDDNGIPNILFSAGSSTSLQSVYLVTPTDPIGLTTWNTSATNLIASATNYIDPTLIEVSPTNFVLFGKDQSALNIVYWTSTSKTGTYTLQNSNVFSGPEAPSIIQISPGKYQIWVDNAGSNIRYATTTTFPTGWSALTTYTINGCEAAGVSGYCFHPHMFTVAGPNGAQ